MTIYTDHPNKAEEQEKPCKGITRLLKARTTELGGFGVRRVLPSSHQTMVGPWIFFDHFGPTLMEPSKGVDIRPHPHINMATVTYIFEGDMLHQDNTGAVQVIAPGAINLMFAGRGIVHSERTPEETRRSGHVIHGLQLWLALPEKVEQNDPRFYHYASQDIPEFQLGQVKGRIMIGHAYDIESPVKTFSPTLYFEAKVPQGSGMTLPNHVEEIGIYIVSGKLSVNETKFETGNMAIATEGQTLQIEALEDTQIAVIGGDQIGKRYIWWNFVSSSVDRINQAALDWQNGLFPEIPTDHEDHIPLPEERS